MCGRAGPQAADALNVGCGEPKANRIIRESSPQPTAHPKSPEPRLDQPPAHLIVRIARRQQPHAMQVIRKHDDRLDPERVARTHRGERPAQHSDVFDQAPVAVALGQVDGKEPSGSGEP